MEGLLYCVCLLYVATTGGIAHVTGLYCTDPDTGKLYEVNSTWPSQTFCGNYTCKLTKLNVTETEYTPETKTNNNILTDNELKQEKVKIDAEKSVIAIPEVYSSLTTDMDIGASEVVKTIKDVSNDVKSGESKENAIPTNKNDTDKRDRYLTETEINVITDILHTVKKSDLEAIIEVYNLAEEIYNEMERTTKTNKLTSKIEKPNANINSIPCQDKASSKDMKTEGTTGSASVYYAYPSNYFQGGINENDLRQLPYYFPMSDFQKMSPYIYAMPPPTNSFRKPCTLPKSSNIIAPTTTTSVRPTRVEKSTTPTMPYSSINIRENIEDYARLYYNYYPWAQLQVYNKHRLPYYINPYYSQAGYVKPTKNIKTQPSEKSIIPKEVKTKSKVIEREVPVKKTEAKKETNMPKWKTEQLSQQVIDEVKANVLDTTKLLNIFPRKSIQLERVGKVLKLDELSRSKRQTDKENMDFGVRLEKIECVHSTEPGFFRMGNLSAPYPACCPQMIT